MNPDENENTIMLTGILPQFFLNPGPGYMTFPGAMGLCFCFAMIALAFAIPHYIKKTTLSQDQITALRNTEFFLILVILFILIGSSGSSIEWKFQVLSLLIVIAFLAVVLIVNNLIIATLFRFGSPGSLFDLFMWYLTTIILEFALLSAFLQSLLEPVVFAIAVLFPLYMIRHIVKNKGKLSRKRLLLIVLLVLIVLGISTSYLNQRRGYYIYGFWEEGAKETLESLATSQELFYLANKRYGTWDELQDQHFIDSDKNRTNIIDNYSICLFDVGLPGDSGYNADGSPSYYKIIALPRKGNKQFLKTFAIGDDSIKKVWIGDKSEFDPDDVDLHNWEHWKPLR